MKASQDNRSGCSRGHSHPDMNQNRFLKPSKPFLAASIYIVICFDVIVRSQTNTTSNDAKTNSSNQNTVLRNKTSEFIYETAPFPSAHASTLVELPNGELMVAWFGGKEEGNPEVAIWVACRL